MFADVYTAELLATRQAQDVADRIALQRRRAAYRRPSTVTAARPVARVSRAAGSGLNASQPRAAARPAAAR